MLELAQISAMICDRVDTVADRWANFKGSQIRLKLESSKGRLEIKILETGWSTRVHAFASTPDLWKASRHGSR